jgi:hypothetical protein
MQNLANDTLRGIVEKYHAQAPTGDDFAGIPYPDYMTLPPNREDLIRWAQSVDLDGVTAVQLILTFT